MGPIVLVLIWCLHLELRDKSEINTNITPERALILYVVHFAAESYKHSFTISILPPHWYHTAGWDPSSCKTAASPAYIINIMAADGLATQGTRASVAMILTYMMTSLSGNSFYVLLALCAGNSPVTGEFPSPRSVTRSFDIFFDLRSWFDLSTWLSKQSRCRWFGTPTDSSSRHCDELNRENSIPACEGLNVLMQLLKGYVKARVREVISSPLDVDIIHNDTHDRMWKGYFLRNSDRRRLEYPWWDDQYSFTDQNIEIRSENNGQH